MHKHLSRFTATNARNSRSWATPKPELNLGRAPSIWTNTFWFLDCTVAGRWDQEWGWDTSRYSIWDWAFKVASFWTTMLSKHPNWRFCRGRHNLSIWPWTLERLRLEVLCQLVTEQGNREESKHNASNAWLPKTLLVTRSTCAWASVPCAFQKSESAKSFCLLKLAGIGCSVTCNQKKPTQNNLEVI